MTFKMISEDQILKVFNLRGDTKEFIGAGDAYVPAHTGLPANCTDVEPPKVKDGEVAVFDDKKNIWNVVDDHRGRVVFNKITRQPFVINALGAISDDDTLIEPASPYDKWDGDKWVKDSGLLKLALINKAEEKRQQLLLTANETVSDWKVELQLETISDDDRTRLIAWMSYIKKVKALDFSEIESESDFDSFAWVELPE